VISSENTDAVFMVLALDPIVPSRGIDSEPVGIMMFWFGKWLDHQEKEREA
jgi:hypothetical protein